MLELIEKLNMELSAVREKAALFPVTAGELSDLSYKIAIMQLCVDAVEYLQETGAKLPEGMVSWVMRKENPLEYLYQMWLHSDYSFVPSLADVLTIEIEHDMEVSVCATRRR